MTRWTLALLASMAWIGAAGAQQLPSTMRLVVTFPPGGTVDVLGRLVANQMGKEGASGLIVDNRPGANSIIGNEFAARSAPDGGVSLMVANSFLITSVVRQLPYDPLKSFDPLCKLVDSPLVIAVGADAPYRTLADFVAAAKAKPGTLTNAAIGPATAQRVAIEMVKRAAGVDVNFVPYGTNALAINALLAGDITSVTVNIADVAGMLADHRVRLLATLSDARIDGYPETPTLRESGYDVAYAVWFGLMTPAKTPPAILDRLSAMVTKAMQSPDLRAKLKPLAFYPAVSCGAPFGAFLQSEFDATKRIVQEAGIKME